MFEGYKDELGPEGSYRKGNSTLWDQWVLKHLNEKKNLLNLVEQFCHVSSWRWFTQIGTYTWYPYGGKSEEIDFQPLSHRLCET